MTPKSLLRHPLSSSRAQDLVEGGFQPVIDDQQARRHPEQIRCVVLCSGKISIDLLAYTSSEKNEDVADVAIVRVEQLYPFPEEQIQQILAGYPRAREVVWVQEEPRNMGAWSYVAPHLSEITRLTPQVVSRPLRSSPATGFWDRYATEQQYIITQAMQASSDKALKSLGGNNVR
jgi:2-oxoglutarate dehydrogenase E1 component